MGRKRKNKYKHRSISIGVEEGDTQRFVILVIMAIAMLGLSLWIVLVVMKKLPLTVSTAVSLLIIWGYVAKTFMIEDSFIPMFIIECHPLWIINALYNNITLWSFIGLGNMTESIEDLSSISIIILIIGILVFIIDYIFYKKRTSKTKKVYVGNKAKRNKKKDDHVCMFLLSIILMGVLIYRTIISINVVYDFSKPQSYLATVIEVDKQVRHSGRGGSHTTYKAEVLGKDETLPYDINKMRIDYEQYSRLNVGDLVSVEYRKGLLGLPWAKLST